MNIKSWKLLVFSCFLAPMAGSAANLTDITVFSSNAEGNNWNSLIWNTQGADTDQPAPGRYNLYVSEDSLTETSPTFLNHFNDANARVSIPLTLGDHTFSIYGEGVGITFDQLQHFVINLYFDGDQSAPAISGVQSLDNDALAAVGHPNGLDIYGNSGEPESGQLQVQIGDTFVTLTDFSWITDGDRDVVWDYWANDVPYSGGSGRLDYYGSFTLNVQAPNDPPVCDAATPSVSVVWPPNHQFVDVQVLGVTDPEGDPVTITIDEITQNEPVDSTGDGSFAPDSGGLGTSTASVRAERDGAGDGRIYTINFTADDQIGPNAIDGGDCSGSVSVIVPHDMSQ